MLESYCQEHVTVLRQAFRVFSREFLIGNIEVFLESLTIASACNKVLRRKFMKHETIWFIPTGGYTCSNSYSKVMISFLHIEHTD